LQGRLRWHCNPASRVKRSNGSLRHCWPWSACRPQGRPGQWRRLPVSVRNTSAEDRPVPVIPADGIDPVEGVSEVALGRTTVGRHPVHRKRPGATLIPVVAPGHFRRQQEGRPLGPGLMATGGESQRAIRRARIGKLGMRGMIPSFRETLTVPGWMPRASGIGRLATTSSGWNRCRRRQPETAH